MWNDCRSCKHFASEISPCSFASADLSAGAACQVLPSCMSLNSLTLNSPLGCLIPSFWFSSYLSDCCNWFQALSVVVLQDSLFIHFFFLLSPLFSHLVIFSGPLTPVITNVITPKLISVRAMGFLMHTARSLLDSSLWASLTQHVQPF